jgi:hypothetical protein
MTREDYRTTTVEDAAYYERHRSDGYTDPMREAPSARELAEDAYYERQAERAGRRAARPTLIETITATLRFAGDQPDVRQARDGVVAIATTLTDDRVAALLRPLGIETGRGTDHRLYARDSLISADPWGNADDIGEPPF